jgi:hypothetical protein
VLISRRAIRGYRDPASRNLPIWKLEAALYCEPCSEGRHYSTDNAHTSAGLLRGMGDLVLKMAGLMIATELAQ